MPLEQLDNMAAQVEIELPAVGKVDIPVGLFMFVSALLELRLSLTSQ